MNLPRDVFVMPEHEKLAEYHAPPTVLSWTDEERARWDEYSAHFAEHERHNEILALRRLTGCTEEQGKQLLTCRCGRPAIMLSLGQYGGCSSCCGKCFSFIFVGGAYQLHVRLLALYEDHEFHDLIAGADDWIVEPHTWPTLMELERCIYILRAFTNPQQKKTNSALLSLYDKVARRIKFHAIMKRQCKE
jgi:hypothetical protein